MFSNIKPGSEIKVTVPVEFSSEDWHRGMRSQVFAGTLCSHSEGGYCLQPISGNGLWSECFPLTDEMIVEVQQDADHALVSEERKAGFRHGIRRVLDLLDGPMHDTVAELLGDDFPDAVPESRHREIFYSAGTSPPCLSIADNRLGKAYIRIWLPDDPGVMPFVGSGWDLHESNVKVGELPHASGR